MTTVNYLACGGNGSNAFIAYSSDGQTWTNAPNVSTLFTNYLVMSVAHNGSIWIAGGVPNGSGAVLAYSYDGINWTNSASGKSIFSSVNKVTYGNGKFIAVGASSSYTIAYSTDGINWIGCANSTFFGGAQGWTVNYVNSTYVAGLGYGTTGTIGYSTDGINWSSVSTTLTSTITEIDWNGNRYVAVGTNTASTQFIIYSSNLTSWSNASVSFGTIARAVKWANGKFIAVGQNNSGGVQFKTSTDGITWTSSTPTNCANPMNAINYNPYTAKWLIGQSGTYPIITSSDGVTWNTTTSSANTVWGFAYALPPPQVIGTAPTITSITSYGQSGLNVYFTPGTGGIPDPTTYYYSTNAGSTYTNANSTTSPLLITGVNSSVNYQVTIIANNAAGNTAPSNISVGLIPQPCFLQGSKILRMNTETDEEEYVSVESLRRGDLVRTANHGYKAVELIGSREIANPLAIEKKSSRLYWFRKSKVSGLREDLCVTGDHCILHKSITAAKKDQVLEHMGDIYVTEDHYRVPAFLDDRAEPYGDSATATIWHFALENPNIYHNYGVMANGLLVESSSLHFMYKYSNMRMI